MRVTSNVGGLDRLLRGGFGIAAIYIAFFDNPILEDPIAKWSLGVPGTIFLATSIARFCPLYNFIGFNSCQAGKNKIDQ